MIPGLVTLLPSGQALAQPPAYTAQYLGPVTPVGVLRNDGVVLCTTTIGGNVRALVVTFGQPDVILPLPEGMISSVAADVNDAGVVVGRVGPYYSPEFFGRAVVWTPDGGGGYTVEYLGELPGQNVSAATGLNNLGDIVGYSSDGTYRYPVLYAGPGEVQDLTTTGVFDPVDVNDHRVLVDHSFTAKRLDLNTMIVEDLGVPPGSYLATRASAINEAGQVAGAAILSTSTDCDRQAARYTDGIGWEVFSVCGAYNTATDMNDLGDVIMRLNLTIWVRFQGIGTYPVENLIQAEVGHWYVVNSFGDGINNARQMVVWAHNPTTGENGAVLLSPTQEPSAVEPPTTGGTSLALSIVPNPLATMTTLGYVLPSSSPVDITIFDSTGRVVRRLFEAGSCLQGAHQVIWDGRGDDGGSVASGVYLARLRTPDNETIRRLVVSR